MVWWVMFFSDLIMPVILIFAGRGMWKHCPQKINMVYGYRTKRSMKNMDTWKYAHMYCGRLWYRTGIILGLITLIVMLFLVKASDKTISIVGSVLCVSGLALMLCTILLTELALRRKFTEEGSEREK